MLVNMEVNSHIDFGDRKFKSSKTTFDYNRAKDENGFNNSNVNKASSTYAIFKEKQLSNSSNIEILQEEGKYRTPSGSSKSNIIKKELMEKTQQKSSYLRNIASKTKELPELEKRTKDSGNKEVERFESEFTYQSILPKPQLKTYLSPEFQSELKDITEGHFFKQKLSGLTGIPTDKQSLKIIATKSMHDTKKCQIDPIELRNPDHRTTNMQRIRSTESSCSSTPVSTAGQNRKAKGRIVGDNGSTSVGPKKMTKANIQMSIADAPGK